MWKRSLYKRGQRNFWVKAWSRSQALFLVSWFQRTRVVLVFVNTMSFIPLCIYNLKVLLGYNLVEELQKIQNAFSI